jgi:hypothetical protein
MAPGTGGYQYEAIDAGVDGFASQLGIDDIGENPPAVLMCDVYRLTGAPKCRDDKRRLKPSR